MRSITGIWRNLPTTVLIIVSLALSVSATTGKAKRDGRTLPGPNLPLTNFSAPGSNYPSPNSDESYSRTSLPFKGFIVGEFVSIPTDNPPMFHASARANGISTQFGKFSKITDDVLNGVTGEITGTFEMTVANGDLVRGQYSGYVVPDVSTFYWILNATITGGTGRFAEATGDFVFEARGDYYVDGGRIIGQYTETFNGTIDY